MHGQQCPDLEAVLCSKFASTRDSDGSEEPHAHEAEAAGGSGGGSGERVM